MEAGLFTVPAPKRLKSGRRMHDCARSVHGRPLDSPATQPNLTSPASRPFFHFDGHKNRKSRLLAGTVDGLFPLTHLIGGGGTRRERDR